MARHARRHRALQVALPIAVAVPVLLAWELYASALRNPLLPGPVRMASALPGVIGNPAVWNGLLGSDLSLLMGYTAALVIGVPLGLLMGRVRSLDAALGIVLDIALVTPMIVVMPVVLMALGLTRESQAVIIMIFALPLVTVPCRTGAREVPEELVEMTRSFGASSVQLWKEVLLPGSVPGIAAGLRLGFGQAITGMAVVELTLLSIGIGNIILGYQSAFRSAQSFDVIGIVIVQSVLVMSALRFVEARVGGASKLRAELAMGSA